MGIDYDAQLCYGVAVDEDRIVYGEDEDWETKVESEANRLGLTLVAMGDLYSGYCNHYVSKDECERSTYGAGGEIELPRELKKKEIATIQEFLENLYGEPLDETPEAQLYLGVLIC